MKKLGKLSINPSKVMKNEDLVNLRGGTYGSYNWGTCGAKSPSGSIICGVTKEQALWWAGPDGWWCCDSCSSSTYCG